MAPQSAFLENPTVSEFIRWLADSDSYGSVAFMATGETYAITDDDRDGAMAAWAFFGDGPIPTPDDLISIEPRMEPWVARIEKAARTMGTWPTGRSE